MSLASLENAMVRELREVTGNQKITKSWITEWGTHDVSANREKGETFVELPKLGVTVLYRKPPKKATP